MKLMSRSLRHLAGKKLSRAVVLGCTSALLLGPVAATGCTFEMAPVMNVQANAPLVREASAEEMKAAIYRALVTKTWVVTAEELSLIHI